MVDFAGFFAAAFMIVFAFATLLAFADLSMDLAESRGTDERPAEKK